MSTRDHGPGTRFDSRVRAGKALRDLSHTLVGHHASDAELEAVADTLESLSLALARGEERRRDHETFPSWNDTPAEGDSIETFADRPISGRGSPLGVDLETRRVVDEAVARFTLRSAHEGAPGRSHGGVVSAIFDDVMGFVLQITRTPAFTGELTVRYEAGVPIGRPLEMRARLDRREGRKLFITAELSDGASRVASARSVFIAVDPESFHGPAAS